MDMKESIWGSRKQPRVLGEMWVTVSISANRAAAVLLSQSVGAGRSGVGCSRHFLLERPTIPDTRDSSVESAGGNLYIVTSPKAWCLWKSWSSHTGMCQGLGTLSGSCLICACIHLLSRDWFYHNAFFLYSSFKKEKPNNLQWINQVK